MTKQYKLSPILHLRSNILDYLPTVLDRCNMIVTECHRNAYEILSMHSRWGQVHSPIFLNFSVKLLVYTIVDLHIFRKRQCLQNLPILLERIRRSYIEI